MKSDILPILFGPSRLNWIAMSPSYFDGLKRPSNIDQEARIQLQIPFFWRKNLKPTEWIFFKLWCDQLNHLHNPLLHFGQNTVCITGVNMVASSWLEFTGPLAEQLETTISESLNSCHVCVRRALANIRLARDLWRRIHSLFSRWI